jgi:xylan 1,4-beta-xylosidase
MGSPSNPTADEIASLEKAGQLELLETPQSIVAVNHTIQIKMQLPRQAVSFLKIEF